MRKINLSLKKKNAQHLEDLWVQVSKSLMSFKKSYFYLSFFLDKNNNFNNIRKKTKQSNLTK